MRKLRAFGIVVAALLAGFTGSLAAAQRGTPLPPPKPMTELLTTLQDKALTTAKEQGLIHQVFSGTVEVLEVQDVSLEPPVDRRMDSIGFGQPSKRVIVDVGGGATPYYLAFETTDVTKASTLKKGDKVNLSGQLVKFVMHRKGYDDKPDKWVIFDNVVFAAK